MEGVTSMFKKQLMPMHLQFFAEPGDNDTPPAEEQTPEFDAQNLTDEQLAAIKEKFGFKDNDEIDTIVKGKKSKWQKELEQEKNEAARLAKLSEEERQQALIQKEKDEFEKEKAVFRQEQLLVEKGRQLQEIGIPSILASRIHGDTAEEAIEDVKSFKAEWDKALKVAVDQALLDSVDNPLGAGANKSEANPFAKDTLNLTEQGRLFKEDPERAKALQALANKK